MQLSSFRLGIHRWVISYQNVIVSSVHWFSINWGWPAFMIEPRCNVNCSWWLFTSPHWVAKSSSPADVLLTDPAVGCSFSTGSKPLLKGVKAAACPAASTWAGQWKPSGIGWRSERQRKTMAKSTEACLQLSAAICVSLQQCNPAPRPLSWGLRFYLAFVARFSFHFCTQCTFQEAFAYLIP